VGAFRSVIAWVLALGFCVAAGAQDARIQYAEKVSVAAVPGRATFQAYGHEFTLELADNSRLLSKLSAQRKADLAPHRFLRGTLVGVDGSWVRLSQIGRRQLGAFWDGRDLYMITSLADARPNLVNPIAGADGDTVFFRLSDVIDALPRAYCASESSTNASSNGLEQFKSLVGEAGVRVEAASLAGQMDVSLIGDGSFQSQEPGDASAAMVARLNTADGIFGSQLGLLLNASDVRVTTPANDPFTATSPSQLLAQVSTYRRDTAGLRNSGVTHLVTAKSFTGADGDVIGLARIGGVCDVDDGVSLSYGGLGEWASGLIMTHEIAHNLGAVHDGVGVCASEAPGYFIMSPEFENIGLFSQCSLNTMYSRLSTTSCITPANVADATPTVTAPALVERDIPFNIVTTVLAQGQLTSTQVGLTLQLPDDLIVDTIVPSAGTCSPGVTPSCTLGDIPASESRTVTVTGRAQTLSNQRTVVVKITSANDRLTANNSSFATYAVVNNADAKISLSSSAARVRMDDAVDYTIRVQALLSRPTRNIRVSAAYGGMRNFTFTPSVGTCTTFGDCSLGDLAPGSSATIAVHGIAAQTGESVQDIRLDSLDDTNGSNNFASFRLTVDPLVNVSVAGSVQSATVNVGTSNTVQFTVANTLGTQAATHVYLTIFSDFWAKLQAVSVSGGTCILQDFMHATCDLGSMPVADSRLVNVSVLNDTVGTGGVTVRAVADRDDTNYDSQSSINIFVRNPIDLALSSGSWSRRVEGATTVDKVTLYSNSTMDASNFALDVAIGPHAHLVSLALPDATCAVVDSTHGRCTASTLPNKNLRDISIGTVGDDPGISSVHLTMSATGDATADDNDRTISFEVTPFRDVSITPFTLPDYIFAGRSYDFETHLRSSYRDVPNVLFTIAVPVDMVITLPPELTTCTSRRDVSNLYNSYDCPMGLVAANTDLLLKFKVVGPTADNMGGRLGIQAWASDDSVNSNNFYDHAILIVEESELSVDFAGAPATANVGGTLTLPRITLHSVKESWGIVLKIPLPSFTSLSSVNSQGWTCTGTTTLECNIYHLGTGADTTFDVVLNASSAGTFTSKIEVTSANDASTANNSKDMAITVNAVTSGGSSSGGSSGSGGGDGGGGSMEWLGLAVLTLLTMMRLGGHRHRSHWRVLV
jgi:Metallo-peptidase family M12B Reprolysin-like/Domain of unknown function DUF11